MFSKKFLRRALATFLISGSLFVMPVTSAEIYTADGAYTMSKYETVDVAEQRAVKDAERYAIEQAGVYIESFSRMNNFDLLEDEVITIASGVLKHVEKPKIRKTFMEDGDSIKIFASIKVEISDADIERYLNNSLENRQQLNSQLESLRQANAAQAQRIKDLEAQIANIKTPQQEESIKEQFAAEDKIFLSNQKTEEGAKLRIEKNFDMALELFNEALELNPNNASAYYGKGSAYVDLKNYNQGLANLNKALKLNPNYADAYSNRGAAYAGLKNYNAAISDLNKAIQLNPNDEVAYSNRGIVLADLKQYDAAISNYNKAIQLKPNYYWVYNNRGVTYMNLKQYDRAISDYNKAIELGLNHEYVYTNRGNAYRNLNQYDAAIADYNKALELNPNDAEAYYWRGYCYHSLGNKQKAQADLYAAKQLGYNG